MKSPATIPSGESAVKAPLRVALVEDQREVRESWGRLVGSFAEFSCVCSSHDVRGGLRRSSHCNA